MTFARAWFRLEAGRRWRSLGVLVLLVALAGGTLPLLIPGAFGAANLLAAWPARSAARVRVAAVLRAE